MIVWTFSWTFTNPIKTISSHQQFVLLWLVLERFWLFKKRLQNSSCCVTFKVFDHLRLIYSLFLYYFHLVCTIVVRYVVLLRMYCFKSWRCTRRMVFPLHLDRSFVNSMFFARSSTKMIIMMSLIIWCSLQEPFFSSINFSILLFSSFFSKSSIISLSHF